MFSDFFSENRAVYEIMSKYMLEPERTQKIWRLRVTYSIRKFTGAQARARIRAPTHTHTHTEICNTNCFLRQQWFRECDSVLRWSLHCLSYFVFSVLSEVVWFVKILQSFCLITGLIKLNVTVCEFFYA